MSLVAETGDWKTRKINLFSLMKGFISQLKPGQELTKVSLPAEICHPYTMLETFAYRQTPVSFLLNDLDKEANPLKRLLIVVKYFLSQIRQETFEKKPLNSVLGETHIAWIIDDKGDTIEYYGEQVSHHPPISAVHIRNQARTFSVSCNVSFGVKFAGNSAAVTLAGGVMIQSEKYDEVYEMDKCLPDMTVKNVVFGKKYIVWEGDVTISCASTGYSAIVKFKEDKGKENSLRGIVTHVDSAEPVLEFEGKCGGKVTYFMTGNPKDTQILVDVETIQQNRLNYLPADKQEPLSSLRVWAKVNKAIVDGEMSLADKEKKLVEADQRKRSAEKKEHGTGHEGKYFHQDENGHWKFKNNVTVAELLSDKLESAPIQVPVLTEHKDEVPALVINGVEKRRSRHTSKGLLAPGTPGSHEYHSDSEVGDNNGNQSPRASPDLSNSPDGDENGSNTNVDYSGFKRATLGADEMSRAERNRLSADSGFESDDGDKRRDSWKTSAGNPKQRRGSSTLKIGRKQIKEEQKQIIKTVKESEKKRKNEARSQLEYASINTVYICTDKDVVMEGWMKLRNPLKKWSFRYFVLKPGRLIFFKDPHEVSKAHCSGIINLQGCEVSIRTSKKVGSCFKIFHLLQYNIYSKQGLKGETLKSTFMPYNLDYCILRVNNDADRMKWMKAMQSAIPDYEKNKTLYTPQVIIRPESDSEDEEDEEDEDEPMPDQAAVPVSALSTPNPTTSVPRQTSTPSGTQAPTPALTPSVSSAQLNAPGGNTQSVSSADRDLDDSLDAIENTNSEEVLEQIYKTIRRIRSEQKRTGSTYEDNLKRVEDRIAQLEKNITNQFKQQQMREQMNKRDETIKKAAHESHGLMGKITAKASQIQLGIFLFLMFWIWLNMRSMSTQLSNMSLAK